MIDYLEGTLAEKDGGRMVVLVGGVGYGVTVSARTAAALGEPGAEIRLWVRTYVREDLLRLYGFARKAEREAFDLLLGIPSVGPGICLALLSELSGADLLQAALAGDTQRLTKVKGIGKKLAEKMLLELKNRTDALAGILEPAERAAAARGAEALPPTGAAADAVAALEALDVPLGQARKAVAKAVEILGPDAATEALVREGLRHRRTV